VLVIAGLTPVEALRTATLNPARFFGLEKMMGAIEEGKIADLVLLDANPLEDIRNTQKIYAVILNGRLLDRKALDKLLVEAQGAANR
jgi:imidazolonepropionase-like amidohydrolase